jgi:zinc protease
LLTVLYRIPAGSHPDNAPLRILAHVMGNSPSGRLYKSLVETRQATSAYASAWSLHDPGVAIVGASMRKEDDPLRVRQQLLSVIEGTATQPVTEAEVTFARQSLLAGMEKTYNDPEQLALALSGSVAQGDWRLLYWQRDALEKISAADVNRVARQYFKPANRTIGEFIPVEKPDRAEIPPAPDLARLLSGYSGRGRVETGEIFDPSPLNLDTRTQRGQLANGMQYALLPKKNRGETVQLALQLNLGAEGSLQGKATIAELTGAMLMRGTQKHSREALAAELIRLKTRLGISASGQHVYLTADTNRANVPAVLALIREILREPAFPDAEYRQLIRQALAGIESARNQPESLAYEAFARHLYPYAPADIRYVPTSTENEARLKAATLDELRAFHRDFYGAAQGQLAIVGDFDVEEARRLAEGALGDWRAAQVFERMTEAYRPVAAQTRILATPDKPNAVFRAGLRLPVGEMHPDYPALRMVAYLLGGGFNSSRLATRLRQQEGMSYTVNAVLGASHFDQAGSLSIYAIYAPQYREKLAQAVDEELARIVRDGFSGQELADGKMAFRERLQIALAQDDSLAAALLGQLEQGESFADDAKFAAAIEALSLQDINTVARRYLHADALSRFFAGDFASSAR